MTPPNDVTNAVTFGKICLFTSHFNCFPNYMLNYMKKHITVVGSKLL